MAALPCLFSGRSCCCNPATWRTRGSKAQEENAGRGINGGDPIAPPGAIGVAAVYAAKARILFLRRARAEPLGYLPRQRRNKRVRDGSPPGRRRSCGSVHESPAPKADARI